MPSLDKHAEYLVGPNNWAAIHYIDPATGEYLSTEFRQRDSWGMLYLDRCAAVTTLPAFDETTMKAIWTEEGWLLLPKYAYEPAPRVVTVPDAITEKKNALAALRFGYEVGGITVGGARIKTDRESQAQLTGAYISLKFGLRTSVDWKGENGWVSVTLAELEPIAHAVSAHVQNSFTQERIHSQEIDRMVANGATVEEIQAYDITIGFKG